MTTEEQNPSTPSRAGRVRLAIEILIVAALAFAIWHNRGMIFGIDDGRGDDVEQAGADGPTKASRASKLFGKTGKASSDGTEAETANTEAGNTTAAATPPAPDNVEASKLAAAVENGSLVPEPTALASGPGTLDVTILEADGSVPDRRVLVVVQEIDQRIPVDPEQGASRRAFDVEPGVYTLVAIAANVDGAEASEPIRAEVQLGTATTVELILPAPPTPTVAHPGLEVGLSEDGAFAQVLAVADGSSAHAQGILVGDAIIMVDGAAIAELTPDEVYAAFRGQPDSRLELVLAFQDETSGELTSETVLVVRNIPE